MNRIFVILFQIIIFPVFLYSQNKIFINNSVPVYQFILVNKKTQTRYEGKKQKNSFTFNQFVPGKYHAVILSQNCLMDGIILPSDSLEPQYIPLYKKKLLPYLDTIELFFNKKEILRASYSPEEIHLIVKYTRDKMFRRNSGKKIHDKKIVRYDWLILKVNIHSFSLSRKKFTILIRQECELDHDYQYKVSNELNNLSFTESVFTDMTIDLTQVNNPNS